MRKTTDVASWLGRGWEEVVWGGVVFWGGGFKIRGKKKSSPERGKGSAEKIE